MHSVGRLLWQVGRRRLPMRVYYIRTMHLQKRRAVGASVRMDTKKSAYVRMDTKNSACSRCPGLPLALASSPAAGTGTAFSASRVSVNRCVSPAYSGYSRRIAKACAHSVSQFTSVRKRDGIVGALEHLCAAATGSEPKDEMATDTVLQAC